MSLPPENPGEAPPPAEFSRWIDVRQVEGRMLKLDANEAERKALAQRFGIVSVGALHAELLLTRDGEAVDARGRLVAAIVQSCAVSAEDLPVAIDEELSFRFVPAPTAYKPDEEIELTAEELDEIPYTGTRFDVGEAVAQSLALAIDPFLTGPGAEAARKAAGIGEPGLSGPFAALAALKKPAPDN